jgi:cell division protein FtsZ
LLGAVQGIAELITRPGLINVDFADVKTVMSEMGSAMMGIGIASGENRARKAAEAAISSPLLDNTNLSGAKGVLVNITSGLDMTIEEFKQVGDAIKAFTSEDATVIIGTVIDSVMEDELRVTLVATGLDHNTNNSNSAVNLITKEVENNFAEQKMTWSKQMTQNNLELSETNEHNMDYLDIPAFLRRQVEVSST